jgi:hypothetical protein
MKGLYLELGALNQTQSKTEPNSPNLIDLLQPEGFIPELNLSEDISTAGSPLNPAKEALAQTGPSTMTEAAIRSAELLSGISDTLTKLTINGSVSTVNTSSIDTVNNSLSIKGDLEKILPLLKIEPKKIELVFKDGSMLEELIKKVSVPTNNETKTTPEKVATGTLSNTTELQPDPTKPKLDISVFRNALFAQEATLADRVNATLAEGGDISTMFEENVVGDKIAKSGKLAETYTQGIREAVMLAEIKQETDRTTALANEQQLLDQGDPMAILKSLTNPLTQTKEVQPPSFNKAIAQGLTDVAESNSKIVSQTSIVNQAVSTLPQSQPNSNNTVENIPTKLQPNTQLPNEADQQPTVAIQGGDPVLAAYMLQMLNLMKSGQLKVKLTH